MNYLFIYSFFFGLRPGHFILKELLLELQKGFIWLEIERAIALFHSQQWLEGIYPPPSHVPNSLNTSNQNFEIAIFFNLVERSRNHIFEDDNPSSL